MCAAGRACRPAGQRTSGRAGGRALSVCLQTRPLSQAPQEAAPVKGLRCAARWSSAPRLPLRWARFPPGAGLRFDGSAQGLPDWVGLRGGQAITTALSLLESSEGGVSWPSQVGEAGRGGCALCVYATGCGGPCCARSPFSNGACWHALCPHASRSVF